MEHFGTHGHRFFISEGNRKLQKNSDSVFLIWNLPAITTCPERSSSCEKFCYARKAERQYKQVLPCRLDNFTMSQQRSVFRQDMKTAIEKELKRKRCQGKKVYFRIHGSGDFYSVDYYLAWCDIARDFPNVRFLAYTHSIHRLWLAHFPEHFEMHADRPNNFIVRYSVDTDTTDFQREQAHRLGLPTYEAVPVGEEREVLRCPGDCSKCKACYDSTASIWVSIH